MRKIILKLLEKKPMTVNEMLAATGVEEKLVRNAIMKLRRDGRIVGRKKRNYTEYSIISPSPQAPDWFYALHVIRNGGTSVESIRYILGRQSDWCTKAISELVRRGYITTDENGWFMLTKAGEDATQKSYTLQPELWARTLQPGDRSMRTASCVFDAAVKRARYTNTPGNHRKELSKVRRESVNRALMVKNLRILLGCKTLAQMDTVLGFSKSYMSGATQGKGKFQNVMFRACMVLDMTPKALMEKIGMDMETVFF